MTALFLIALLLLAVTVALVLRAIALPRIRMAAHLRQIETYGISGTMPRTDALNTRPPLGRSINALAESIGRFAMSSAGALKHTSSRELASAGFYRISVEAFHGYRVLTSTAVPLLLVFEVVGTSGKLATAVMIGVLAVTVCWTLFGTVVRRRSEARLHNLDRELPKLIDVLIATVEAGLGFAGSLQLVAGRFEGPLGDELRLALQEQQMGLATSQALSNILERSDTPAMRSFVRAIVQGETLGVSIGAILRNLALEMRTRRRQAAQERIQKAPLKMLFPLVFMIFPAMFVVLLYPAFYEITTGLSRV